MPKKSQVPADARRQKMKMRNSLATIASRLAISVLLSASIALAQTSGSSRTPQNVPDLSGMWGIAAGGVSWDPADPAGQKPEQMPMTPWARNLFKEARPPFGAKSTFDNPNDPTQKYCDSPGITRLYDYPWQFTIIQTPKNVFLLFEYFHTWRVVTMNQQHPKDLDPTWLGDSVGHYEGDALVIDTVGFNDKTWLDNAGHPHSDKLHTIERLHRIGPKTLQLDLTIDDPKAYPKPFTAQKTFQSSSFPLGETLCSLSETQAFQKHIMDRTVPSLSKK